MFQEPQDSLKMVEQKLGTMRPNSDYAHDAYVMAAIEEAILAVKEDNFGVGAVMLDPEGAIVQRGHNRMFAPYFRSDRHAEMDVLTRFEERFKGRTSMAGYTLVTSLEPCPMCLTRLISAQIGKVFYAAQDSEGGMATRLSFLPPVWVELASGQVFAAAQCAPELSEMSLQVVLTTAQANTQKLLERG